MLIQVKLHSDFNFSYNGQALGAWPFFMSSYNSEIMKALKKNGWKFKRRGAGHDIYTNGVNDLTIPRGTKMYSRSYKTILKQVKGDLKPYSRSKYLTRYSRS
jgi:predicted RNA binding protein YcfA (HicA-like mRNA interferase family)